MIDRIIDLIYVVVILLTAVGFYRLGKGEKVINVEKIVTEVAKFKPTPDGEVIARTEEEEAAIEQELLKRDNGQSSEEMFKKAKEQ